MSFLFFDFCFHSVFFNKLFYLYFYFNECKSLIFKLKYVAETGSQLFDHLVVKFTNIYKNQALFLTPKHERGSLNLYFFHKTISSYYMVWSISVYLLNGYTVNWLLMFELEVWQVNIHNCIFIFFIVTIPTFISKST